MQDVIAKEPLARIDYVSVADPETFQELSWLDGPALALLAVHIGRARLIDTLRLE
jgi:pantoate--beta-alanine ligase